MMKPCLDPFDPECPKTAPNYKTKKVNIPVLFKEPVKQRGTEILWNLRDEIVGSGIPKIL